MKTRGGGGGRGEEETEERCEENKKLK